MRNAQRERFSTAVRYVALSLFAVPWVLLPLWLMLVNSLKPLEEAQQLSIALPEEWAAVENYAQVFTEGDYPTALRNSLIVVLPTIAVVLVLGSLAAWAFARSRSMSLKVAYAVLTLSILLRPALLPTLYLLDTIGIGRSTVGYILVTIAVRLGLVVFLATGFIRAMPADFEEAAALDGADRFQIWWHMIIPMTSSVLFVGVVLLVINVWNEFFFASFLLPGTDQATLPLALYRFSSTSTGAGGSVTMNWNLIFAHVVATSLPLIVVYLFAQRRVLAGLTEGGVKS